MNGAALRQRDKDHVALGAAVLSAVAAVLIWTLWVLPIARSVGDAEPAVVGETLAVDLDAGAVGIWGSGRTAAFGTLDCIVTAPDGARVPLSGPPSLTWEDVLWWTSPRPGFSQLSRFTAPSAGRYDVACVDSLDTYDGEVLVAGDTFGSFAVGLGRSGTSGFPVGSVLAFCAVVLPLFAVLLPIVIGLRRRRDGRRADAVSRSRREAARDPRR
ncbi:MAG: hypothetical protein J7484_09885 [Microbacterium sp.]|nr:hypothetical protein [Microbacterium sp.]